MLCRVSRGRVNQFVQRGLATVAFQGNECNTVGDLPAVGSAAPDFDLVGAGLSEVNLASHAGKRVVLNIFPSLDTGTCANSVKAFNQKVGGNDDAVCVCVSQDLPFAQGRFADEHETTGVVMASAFRSTFADDYGVKLADGPLAGLATRAVVVLDAANNVIYTELCPEITEEPDYDAALGALEN